MPDRSNIPASGHPDEWIKERLAEMGLSEDDVGSVMEGAGGLHAQGGRWKICPRCKSNIDMLTWVRGQDGSEWPKLLARGEIECPNRGAYGESFGSNAMNEPHAKLKTFIAKQVHNPFHPWAAHYIRIGKAIVEENCLFPSDPRFDANEQHWPRDLAACIVGAALIIASSFKGPPKGPRKGGDRRPPRHNGKPPANSGNHGKPPAADSKQPGNVGNNLSPNERGMDFGS